MLRDEFKRIEDELNNKKSDDIDKKKLNDELINVKKNLNKKNKNITNLEYELNKKNIHIKKLDNKIKNLDTEKSKEIKELQNELENAYKIINEKKEENHKLNILNDRLIKEKKRNRRSIK